ncbi:tetratricopeptide repeat protein [Thermoflavimicrobium daqui]|uniref:Sel1 repeat family protein n=1 Tax=Thermoflavimicrobium daqui TaxID=2137476 RepID=A0A364K781_9BACL|nr:tetratricopeptide repeat protein [Thermoflavimicrobium daqui]RAL26166.1 hypothetical protein DL897_03985 [Thermoflavimicrobium daqui]
MIDIYEILKISQDASIEEVKQQLQIELRKWSYRINAPQLEHRQEAERMLQRLEQIQDRIMEEENKPISQKDDDSQKFLPSIQTEMERSEMSEIQKERQWEQSDIIQDQERLSDTIVIDENTLREAVKSGDREAMQKLGSYLLTAGGLGQDQEGEYWIREAAKQGDAEAMRCLGHLFLQKEYLKDYLKKGKEWLVKAAQAGSIQAMRELGLVLLQGNRLKKDRKEAEKWLRKAGEAGDVAAMKELGFRLMKGDGLKRNEKWGKYWLTKAAHAGDLEAKKKLENDSQEHK